MNGKFNRTAVVIRSYKNPHVTKRVNEFLSMGFGKVYVVVNAAEDKGATRGFLSEVKDKRLSILDVGEGYSWSNALNLAIMAIQIADVKRNFISYVFNVSVEALFKREQIAEMLDAITDDPYIGVVGTSFVGRQDGNLVDLGRSYRHPRNTGMLISLRAIGRLWGGFDAWCDGAGGMEDIDFVLRLRALTDHKAVMLDLKVELLLGKHYHQVTKEAREQAAMDKIMARWRALFHASSDERRAIDAVIVDMRLERD